MKLLVLLVGVWCFITPSSASAGANIYVSANASGTQDGSLDNPYSNFAAALRDDSIRSGTHIDAFPGTYTGENNYNLVINSSLSLAFGVQGSGDVVIDFGGTTARFLLVDSEDLPFSVEGYTFQNQAQGSENPVLSFKSTAETSIYSCTFQNVGFAVSMISVEEIDMKTSFFDSCISPTQNGPAIYSQDSPGTIRSTNFVNCQGNQGGAIYIDNTPGETQLNLEVVDVGSCTAAKSGGGVYISEGIVSLISTTIHNNTAGESGGGVYSQVPFSASAGAFSFNKATDGVGGGFAIESAPSSSSTQLSSTSLKSLTVDGNMAPLGGGLHLSSLSPVFLSDLSIIGNTATTGGDEESGDEGDVYGRGGGVYVAVGSDGVTMDSTTIALNVAGERGGGVYIEGSSGSSLIQMRAGCIVEGNTASESGGGIELGGPVVYAGFNVITVDNNIVTGEGGVGGGLMLRGSAVVRESLVTNNMAENGGGVEIDQAGLVTFVDNTITYNNATEEGGGMRITTSSGVLVKGGSFSSNNAQQGGGAYVGPSLPVEFSFVSFLSNFVSKAGSDMYVSGSSQGSLGGVNLVKVRNCQFFDTTNYEAVYSNGGELVLDGTCHVDGLTVVGDSSVSVCDCSAAVFNNLQIEGGSFLTDSDLSVNKIFWWLGGDMYGVNSTACVTGLKDTTPLAVSPTVTIGGSGSAGSDGSGSFTSYSLDWAILEDFSLNIEGQKMSIGDNSIKNDGRLTVEDSATVQCSMLYNYGKVQLGKNSVADTTLVQVGELELRYTSIPYGKTDLATVTKEDNQEGSKLYVSFPSPDTLSNGDVFFVLKWGSYSGEFSSFELSAPMDKKTRGQLEYKDTVLEVKIVKQGGGAGSITGIVIGVLILVGLIVAAALYFLRQRSLQNSYGEFDESGGEGFAAEEAKVLGSSGEPN